MLRTGLVELLLTASLMVAGIATGAGADRGRLPAGSVELRRGAHGELIVHAFANGVPIPMIVDTGSTHTSVTDGLVRALNLPLVAKVAVSTSVGEVIQPVARLDRLTLAGESVAGLAVSVIPQETLDPEGVIQGVIGQDVLSSAAYTIDFVTRRLMWTPDPGLIVAGMALDLELDAGRFVAAVPQAHGLLRLVPDTGAEALILFGSGHRLSTHDAAAEAVWVETVSGRQLARLVVVPRLQIGDTTLRNVLAALLPERRQREPALDGLLPLSLFSRVTIDGPGRRLWLER